MGRIRDLETQIRDLVTHYRFTHVLLQDLVNANVVWSALDAIGDTQLAIDNYQSLDGKDHAGFNYLAVYGVLQIFYVQQDAVWDLFESLDIPITEFGADITEVREARNKATGHPTRREGSKKKGIPPSSHFISRPTLSLAGFQLMSAIGGTTTQFADIRIFDLLKKQEEGIVRLLELVVRELHKREEEHKMKFKGKSVTSVFPDQLSYYFEKVFEGTTSVSSGRWEWGRAHVDLLLDIVAKLRQAFVERALLPASDGIEHELQATEYPIQKLKRYYDSAPDNTLSNKDAYIYAFYIRHQFEELKKLAKAVDEEFQTDEGEVT